MVHFIWPKAQVLTTQVLTIFWDGSIAVSIAVINSAESSQNVLVNLLKRYHLNVQSGNTELAAPQ